MTVLWKWVLKELHHHSAPPVVARLLFKIFVLFYHEYRLLVFRATTKMGKMEIKQGKNAVKLTILNWIYPLFLTKHVLDCCKFFVNFYGSEKVNWPILVMFSLLLWRREFLEVLSLLFPLSYYSTYHLSVKCLFRCTACKWLFKNLNWQFRFLLEKVNHVNVLCSQYKN